MTGENDCAISTHLDAVSQRADDARRLAAERRPAKQDFVGDGGFEVCLRARLRACTCQGLAERVFFLGLFNDLKNWLPGELRQTPVSRRQVEHRALSRINTSSSYSHTPPTSLWLMRTGRSTRSPSNSPRANVHPTASWLIGDGARSRRVEQAPSLDGQGLTTSLLGFQLGKVQHVGSGDAAVSGTNAVLMHTTSRMTKLYLFSPSNKGPWWQNRKMIWLERPLFFDCRLRLDFGGLWSSCGLFWMRCAFDDHAAITSIVRGRTWLNGGFGGEVPDLPVGKHDGSRPKNQPIARRRFARAAVDTGYVTIRRPTLRQAIRNRDGFGACLAMSNDFHP